MQLPPVDPTTSPLSPEQAAGVNQLVASLTPVQVAWLGGYLTGVAGYTQSLLGLLQPGSPGTLPAMAQAAPAGALEVTVLFGSQTGNSEKVAKKVVKLAATKGIKATAKDMGQYRLAALKQEKHLLVVVSTHGEGEPPDRVREVHEFLFGKRAPKLDHLHFSVLALGDRTYKHYCKIGKDFDARLAELGASRIFDRTDCDVDYEAAAERWMTGALDALQQKFGQPAAAPLAGFPALHAASAEPQYDKKKPFPARILDRVNLNDDGSAKETIHVELSLEGSGLTYQPGDSLGVYPTNNPAIVAAIFAATGLDPQTRVTTHEGEGDTLEALLTRAYDISNLTPDVIERYAKLGDVKPLQELLREDRWDDLQAYLRGRDVLDLLRDHPVKLFANDLLEVLRKQPPRLYSLASSPLACPDEAHLCIAVVRYESHGREREGVCSTFFADRAPDDALVPVYIHSNNYFRLPENPSTPVIMIGPGTGVAPFRAFLQHREASGADGRNWLFFGEQHFQTDFLYQAEWLQFLKSGVLTKLSVAFSRDQADKVYVQHRMREQAAELYAWLEQGAHVYVCGDESRMAHDVHAALVEIVAQEGKRSPDDATEYVKNLQKANRYQRDVY